MTATVTDETRAIVGLRPDPKNARHHTPTQVDEIADSIRRFGMVAPIVVRPNGLLIGGHATLIACQKLGHREINCRVVSGLTDPQYRALALALNRLPEHSRWDDAMLAEALRELSFEDSAAAGFSLAEIEKLTAEPEPIELAEIDTSLVLDEFWISVRGPLKHQAAILKGLQELATDVDGVTVELGTIALE